MARAIAFGLRRERGMTSLQAVLLLGAGFLVVWGLMELFEGNKGTARENVALTLRGEFKRPQGGGRPPGGANPGNGGNGAVNPGDGTEPPGGGEPGDGGPGEPTGGDDQPPPGAGGTKPGGGDPFVGNTDLRDAAIKTFVDVLEKRFGKLDPQVAKELIEELKALSDTVAIGVILIDLTAAVEENNDAKILAGLLKFGLEVAKQTAFRGSKAEQVLEKFLKKTGLDHIVARVLGDFAVGKFLEATAQSIKDGTDAGSRFIWDQVDYWFPDFRRRVIEWRMSTGWVPPNRRGQ